MDSPADRLKKARIDAGYATATDAARAMGMKPPTYLGHENGTTGLRRGAAISYAKFYGLSLDWLLTGTGEGQGKQFVPVMGYVGAGAEVFPSHDFHKGRHPDQVDPSLGGSDCLAVRIRGDFLQPLQAGWLLFYDRDFKGVPKNCIGQLCVVQVKDGPVLVRTLKAVRKNRCRLETWNSGKQEDFDLDWASRVIDIRPVYQPPPRSKAK